MSASLSLGVAGFITLLGCALFVSIAAERVRIPAAVMLVAVGAAVGTFAHVRPPFDFGPTLLFVFLPPLVFEAAWNIDLPALGKAALQIAFLAVPGTLFTAFLVAAALAAARVLPFGAAVLFGAIVCATDPVAVVAVFRKIPVPTPIKTLVEAESLSNDGVSVVLYAVALVAASGGTVSVVPAIGLGCLQIVGGIAVGLACAIPLLIALRGAEAAELEVTGTIAVAYVAYLLADHFHVSGIFATAAAAILLRALLAGRNRARSSDDVDIFWNAGAYIANATVFLATGLSIDVPRSVHEPVLVVLAVAAIALSRIVLVALVVRGTPARTTVFLAGMRGALPLALALALPISLRFRPVIVDGVFATVLITLVVQGILLEPIVRRQFSEPAPVRMA